MLQNWEETLGHPNKTCLLLVRSYKSLLFDIDEALMYGKILRKEILLLYELFFV